MLKTRKLNFRFHIMSTIHNIYYVCGYINYMIKLIFDTRAYGFIT